MRVHCRKTRSLLAAYSLKPIIPQALGNKSADEKVEAIMRRESIFQYVIRCIPAIVVIQPATAQVSLSLEPASIAVSPGEAFEVQLWARGDTAQSFDGADAVLRWNPSQLTLNGNSDDDTPYSWLASGFPPASAFNQTWDDGDALYDCMSPLHLPSPLIIPPRGDGTMFCRSSRPLGGGRDG